MVPSIVRSETRDLRIPQNHDLDPLRGNDYGWILERAAHSPVPPELAVSIVIPVYDRREMLAKTLAALTHQTWPRDRMQVVIADDGSRDGVEEVVERHRESFDLVHVRQADRGYRLAEVRNRATRVAKHDAIVMLDCDVLPVPGLVEAFVRLLAVSDRAVLLGPRRYVDASPLDAEEILADPRAIGRLPDLPPGSRGDRLLCDWRHAVYRATDDLRGALLPFGCTVGANLAYSRATVEGVGGWCEDFQAWGREDGELGFRLFDAGCWFVPVPEAVGLHHEPRPGEDPGQADRSDGRRITTRLLTEKCPLVRGRTDPGRRYEVPKLGVVIPEDAEASALAATRASLARQTLRDHEVISMAPDERLAAAMARSRAPLGLLLPAGFELPDDGLERRVDPLLETGGCLATDLSADEALALRRAWKEGATDEIRRLTRERPFLFWKRHGSRAGWAGSADPLASLSGVTGLSVEIRSSDAGRG